MGRRTAAVIVAIVAAIPAPAAADDCSRGPVSAPASHVRVLALDPTAWGGYCEGLLEWAIAPTSGGLRLEYGGGDPYSNIHFYRHLDVDPEADHYRLIVEFEVPATTHDNAGGPSLVQALEFTASAWVDGTRFEWAVQWNNVGPGAPGWRYWDPTRAWVPIGIDQTLEPGWHVMLLEGRATGRGDVRLDWLMVDGEFHRLRLVAPSSPAPSVPDLAAVAIQLDGNAFGDPYAVVVGDVSLTSR